MNMRRHQPKRSDGASILWPLEQGRQRGPCGVAKPPRPRETHRYALDKGKDKEETKTTAQTAARNKTCLCGEREGDVDAPRGLPAFGSMTRQRLRPAGGLCVPRNKPAACRFGLARERPCLVCVFGARYDLTECRVVGGRHDRNIIGGHHQNFSREPQATGGCGVSRGEGVEVEWAEQTKAKETRVAL